MKVLHVIPSLSRADGGPTRALSLMERALAAQGVTVETAATDDDGPGRRNGKACGRPLSENGALRWYFPKRLDFYKPAPAFARWIRAEVGRYDLVHIHALFSFVVPTAAWAARRAGVPYVVRPLGTLNAYGLQRRRPGLKALSMRFIEAPVLRGAAAVHFTSDEEAAEARAVGVPLREAVIPLAVESFGSAHQAREPSRGAPCILFLSRLDPKKNVEGLLEALALLKNEIPALRLLVAGGGSPEYVASLGARAEKLGVSQQITWAGHLEGDEKARAFASADLFALPSFSENFGIAAAEALAAGLPCVLGRGVAIARQVVDAGAGVAVATDAASIARGLRLMIGDEERLRQMSVNAQRLAQERFSMQTMGESLKQLYTDILNGANGFYRSR